jgi:hypothetical protein
VGVLVGGGEADAEGGVGACYDGYFALYAAVGGLVLVGYGRCRRLGKGGRREVRAC